MFDVLTLDDIVYHYISDYNDEYYMNSLLIMRGDISLRHSRSCRGLTERKTDRQSGKSSTQIEFVLIGLRPVSVRTN